MTFKINWLRFSAPKASSWHMNEVSPRHPTLGASLSRNLWIWNKRKSPDFHRTFTVEDFSWLCHRRLRSSLNKLCQNIQITAAGVTKGYKLLQPTSGPAVVKVIKLSAYRSWYTALIYFKKRRRKKGGGDHSFKENPAAVMWQSMTVPSLVQNIADICCPQVAQTLTTLQTIWGIGDFSTQHGKSVWWETHFPEDSGWTLEFTYWWLLLFTCLFIWKYCIWSSLGSRARCKEDTTNSTYM